MRNEADIIDILAGTDLRNNLRNLPRRYYLDDSDIDWILLQRDQNTDWWQKCNGYTVVDIAKYYNWVMSH